MAEYQTKFLLAIIVSFLVGVLFGYTLSHRDKSSKTLTTLQIVSIGIFFSYLGLTSTGKVQYSDIVAVSILAMTGGEPIGRALAKFAEKAKKDL